MGSNEDGLFQTDAFSPSDYIRDRLKGVKIGDETRKLRQLRSEMSALNHASQETLKNNVFRNYQQFIDSSKEISHLEREIYQLTHSLIEQKQVIENLLMMTDDDKNSIHTVSSHSTTTSNTNPIQILMQKMEGIGGILNNMSTSEKVILHGEMEQFDVETKKPVQKCMLILLSHRLIIGNINAAGKYVMESTLSLNSVAPVNVKDRESGAANAGKVLKLLIFPESRCYLCESARIRTLWFDELEQAKREILHKGSLVRQATIRGKRQTVKERKAAAVAATVIEEKSTFQEEDEDVGDEERSEFQHNASRFRKVTKYLDDNDISWLSELPAELDDCIAHRDLDQAVELIHEWKQCPTKDAVIDIQLQMRENTIVQLLSDDVSRPGAVHGGPRAMKKARTLLTQLGRGTYATDVYLRRRSAMQRNAMRDVTVSEEPISYVKQLCTLYGNAVSDIANEFRSMPQYYCQVLQWCSYELSTLLNLIRRHVIEVAPAIAVIAYTWKNVMHTMEDLTAIGVHLNFEVNRLLSTPLERALQGNFENICDAVKMRISEEKWRPYVLDSESALNRLVEELSDVGINVEWAISANDETKSSLNVSQNVVHFARVAHTLSKDLAPLRLSPIQVLCEVYADELWKMYLQHLSDNIRDGAVFAYSTTFILTMVLPVCDKILYGEEGELIRLIEQFPSLAPYADPSDDEKQKDDEEVAHV
ncbi:CRE-EXOC-8 protein [Caenorhabditis remanei]|uniref:CRE-EXOC-8 protein n=1 Tax=Caenorhabditis remanei TaxID=31234 RepID=E3N1P1_CAERE|nr:CRE-EXOC-8 protein [Caenorhabditis remanei]